MSTQNKNFVFITMLFTAAACTTPFQKQYQSGLGGNPGNKSFSSVHDKTQNLRTQENFTGFDLTTIHAIGWTPKKYPE